MQTYNNIRTIELRLLERLFRLNFHVGLTFRTLVKIQYKRAEIARGLDIETI